MNTAYKRSGDPCGAASLRLKAFNQMDANGRNRPIEVKDDIGQRIARLCLEWIARSSSLVKAAPMMRKDCQYAARLIGTLPRVNRTCDWA